MSKLLTPAEVAEMLSIAPITLYQMVHYGRIPAVKISARCLRFRAEDIQKWIAEKTHGVNPRPMARVKGGKRGRPRKNTAEKARVDAIVEQARQDHHA